MTVRLKDYIKDGVLDKLAYARDMQRQWRRNKKPLTKCPRCTMLIQEELKKQHRGCKWHNEYLRFFANKTG